MELFLLVILAAVIGYFLGRTRSRKVQASASKMVIDTEAKDSPPPAQS
jgi:hypothetical protein